ncbi:hypothetical protein [Bacteroides xylanisolvens]|uniref:hypothetical protein n=1 Tax=Bacteroides xylanisolvens TaxID=371601 RepID=UPI002165499A|nr:hypothetical protein [Bacteroides xylanisolvens]MCS2625106.1 hypothetical protein [Bacteroides xylanisolvens]MCS3023893.1 hypothetical protein [Bacteroides xylanisolvens]
MSSNVIRCPKKWFSDEGGMSANRGKAGQKEICDKKKRSGMYGRRRSRRNKQCGTMQSGGS